MTSASANPAAATAGAPSGTANKRKLSTSAEDGRQSAPPPPLHSAHVGPGSTPLINYLLKSSPERLRLIHGDDDTFRDVLEMINNYEGVLNSNESLAANLGAKLVGPLLLKSFEKLFEGPINIIQSSYTIQNSPVTWLDIVTYARNNPSDFVLPEGARSCRFYIKGGQVEISEDDFRLIASGGPERMLPTTPIAEDEATELSTLNILESRLGMLIKKADAVAGKARQLKYHLNGRKSAITARKANEQSSSVDPDTQSFPAINARSSQPPTNDAARQAQLLDHYTFLDRRTSLPQIRPRGSMNGQDSEARNLSQTPSSVADRNRDIMAKKIEKLKTGDLIDPPCDRCRRIGSECRKYLTACQACTKKHARCLWQNAKDGEIDGAQLSMGSQQQSTPTPQRSSGTENGETFNTPQRSSGTENGGNFNNSPGLFVPQNPVIQPGQLPLSVPVGARVDSSSNSQDGTTLAEIATAASVAGTQ